MEPGGVSLKEFTLLQTAMSRKFNTDPIIKDLPRVMRVPGFWHQKKDPPIMVHLRKVSEWPLHTGDSLIRDLNLSIDEDPKVLPPPPPPPGILKRMSMDDKVKRCRAYLNNTPPAVQGQQGDLHTYRVAMIGGDFGLSDADFFSLLCEWNMSCDPPWGEEELRLKIENAEKYRKKPIGWRLFEDRDGDGISKIRDRRKTNKKSGPMPPDPYERFFEGGGNPESTLDGPPLWAGFEEIGDGNVIPLPSANHQGEEGSGGGGGRGRGRGRDGGGGDGGSGGGGGKKGGDKRPPPGEFGVNSFKPIAGAAPSESTPVNVMGETFVRKYKVMQDISKAVYLYNHKYWMEVTKEFLEGMAMELDHVAYTKKSRRRETIDYSLARNQIAQISWNNVEEFEIPMKDGVINALNGKLRPHRWDDFLDKYLPHSYANDAKAPLWEECLEDWFPGERDKKDALQEFFGYILLSGTAAYKKALFLYGESDTGKSVVANVAREMVGMHNVCQIRLEDMDDPKKRAPIKGKLLNLISELPQWGKLAESGFKMLVSTGEPVEIEKKYVNSMTIVPTCKHLIATNSLPWINDSTQATFNRLLILKFENVIAANKMDRTLLDRLIEEMPGIINWSMAGAKRLIESGGQFTTVRSSENIIAEYKTNSNPIRMFIDHSGMVRADDEGRIQTGKFTELFNKFRGGRPMSFQRSLKLIKDAKYDITEKTNGYRWIVGIRETTLEEQQEQMGQIRIFKHGRKKVAADDEFDF